MCIRDRFHIIRTVEDVAKENHVARIQRVTLQLGEVSGVVESYLQDCWKSVSYTHLGQVICAAQMAGEQRHRKAATFIQHHNGGVGGFALAVGRNCLLYTSRCV